MVYHGGYTLCPASRVASLRLLSRPMGGQEGRCGRSHLKVLLVNVILSPWQKVTFSSKVTLMAIMTLRTLNVPSNHSQSNTTLRVTTLRVITNFNVINV